MYYYIFDVDSTLYQIPNNNFQKYIKNIHLLYNNIKCDIELCNLISNIPNKYIISNASKLHVNNILNKLDINKYFLPKNIACLEDFAGLPKPHMYSYFISMRKFNIKNTKNKILFFEDNLDNLKNAKSIFSWTTILISKNIKYKPIYVDFIFPNIIAALKYFNKFDIQ